MASLILRIRTLNRHRLADVLLLEAAILVVVLNGVLQVSHVSFALLPDVTRLGLTWVYAAAYQTQVLLPTFELQVCVSACSMLYSTEKPPFTQYSSGAEAPNSAPRVMETDFSVDSWHPLVGSHQSVSYTDGSVGQLPHFVECY